jgi:Fic family protein
MVDVTGWAADELNLPVPPVQFESGVWSPRQIGVYSGAEMRRQTGSYRSVVTPRIADWRPRLSLTLASDAEDATRALADFDTYTLRTLGTDDPALGPMSAVLLRTESSSSSQIEHLTTSARQLALAEIDEGEKANAREVIGNVRAMEAAVRLADRIDEASILAMHRELLLHHPGFEEHAGAFREELVWIGMDNAGPLGARFVPPQHGHIGEAIRDLVEFTNRLDMPVVIQVAVAHAQFETIHPFVDGNGRTGRALAQATLRNKGLVSHTTVPLSAGLLMDTESYFDALEAFRAGEAGPIVRRIANAARFAAVTGRRLVDDLAAELADSREKLHRLRRQALAWRVLATLVAQPVVSSAYLRRRFGMNDVTAARTLELLTTEGVLEERSGKRRNRVWQHSGILNVLDAYAAKVRRGAIP